MLFVTALFRYYTTWCCTIYWCNAPLFNVFNFALFTTALSLYSVPVSYYSTTIGCYTLFKLYYLMLQYFNIALCILFYLEIELFEIELLNVTLFYFPLYQGCPLWCGNFCFFHIVLSVVALLNFACSTLSYGTGCCCDSYCCNSCSLTI